MNRLSTIALLFAGLVMAGKCEKNVVPKPLEGSWICTWIATPGKPEAASPTLRFNISEKSAAGNGGCNSWFSSYETDDAGAVKFGMIGATKMACNDGREQIESAFFNALRDTDGYRYEPDGKLILRKGKTKLARFEKQ